MTLARKRKATFASEKENDETCNFFLQSALQYGEQKHIFLSANIHYLSETYFSL